jgi:hypothetical protein
MGDGTRIGGPPSSPQPVTTNSADLETTETSASTSENKPIQDDSQVDAKSTTAFKQTSADAKAQKNYAGGTKQKELSDNLAAPPRTIQAGDNPVELSKINVQRDTTQQGGVINRYPNGVTLERSKDNSIEKLAPPPGGSIESSDGQMIARDANRREVARLDKDGTLHVKTKHGEYTESPDGKVKFETKEKGNPGDLRKPGRIPSNNYEDYGISTDRTTVRFPNGIEFNKKTRQITVPVEYHGGFREDKHYVGPRTGYGPNGRELYKVERDGLNVRTPDGTFKIGADDTISYEPNKP